MDKLIEIADKAIADYGFRQIVMWSPNDVIDRWELSPSEAATLEGPVRRALEGLSVPVEPADIPREKERFARIVRGED